MEFFNSEVQSNYDRQVANISDDPFGSSHTLSLQEVIRAHYLIADFFITEQRELGGIGPRSLHLLQSALYRPWVEFGGVVKWQHPLEKAATTLFGLIKDHPFHDANKRTALLSTLFLLTKLGRMPECSKNDFENLTVEIAEMAIVKRSRYQQLAESEEDPEIKYIFQWLKKNTRKTDNREYAITYRELRRILSRYGFVLENPNNNTIDLIQISKHSHLASIFLGHERRSRIARVGYPGDTKQVSKGDLKRIRKHCNLTTQDGIDSQSFYNGVDDMTSLLSEYQENLRRLADR